MPKVIGGRHILEEDFLNVARCVERLPIAVPEGCCPGREHKRASGTVIICEWHQVSGGGKTTCTEYAHTLQAAACVRSPRWIVKGRNGIAEAVDSGHDTCRHGSGARGSVGDPIALRIPTVIPPHDSPPCGIRQGTAVNQDAFFVDVLLPEGVEERLVFLYRTAIGNAVLVIVVPIPLVGLPGVGGVR